MDTGNQTTIEIEGYVRLVATSKQERQSQSLVQRSKAKRYPHIGFDRKIEKRELRAYARTGTDEKQRAHGEGRALRVLQTARHA